jgi:hypothetical protein
MLSLLFKPAAPETPMSRLCEAVYPIIGGKELKFAAMSSMQKYQCMKAILQVMEVWSAITHSAYAEGISDYFEQIAIDYLKLMAVDNATVVAEWSALLGQVPGFDLNSVCQLVETNYTHLPDNLSEILVVCSRFAKAYDEIFKDWEAHVLVPITHIKINMKYAKNLGTWESLYPTLRLRFDTDGISFDEKHAAKIFREMWGGEYKRKSDLLLGDALQKAYGRPCRVSEASTMSNASATSVESAASIQDDTGESDSDSHGDPCSPEDDDFVSPVEVGSQYANARVFAPLDGAVKTSTVQVSFA